MNTDANRIYRSLAFDSVDEQLRAIHRSCVLNATGS